MRSTPVGWCRRSKEDGSGPSGALVRTCTSEEPAGGAITDVAYGYDVLGRLTSVTMQARDGQTLADPEVTEYLYDTMGNLDQVLQSNGPITDYA